jgi:hypothetical protein
MYFNMPTIYKVKDNSTNYYKDKGDLINLCMRLIIVGASERSGKSNIVCNLLMRDEFYLNDYKSENIYIISPSAHTDNKLKKLIEVRDIPEENIMTEYDEDVLNEWYKMQQEDYDEAIDEGKKPEHKLIIMDDLSYNGCLKESNHGVISKMACNGRHYLINFIITAQKYTQIPTTLRENCNSAIFFNCSNKQLGLIEEDFNYLSNKKDFIDMFKKVTDAKHSFLLVNHTNDKGKIYMDSEFKII